MLEGGLGALWTGAALLAVVSAGPLSRFPRESEDYQNIDLSAYANFTANEVCFSEGEVFQKGDVMPNPGPCEECRCEPPSIVCQMVRCPVNNNGCRTIQKPNHCCPDYKCECDYNNQLYGDGERIDLPEDPCQVCYCKGGEVMCTSLKCYLRDDCEPQHVPGQCCPKYENCPIRGGNSTNGEDKSIRLSNKTAKREMQPWLLTKVVVQTPSVAVPRRVDTATTEGSSVVIVSDWLSERHTTSSGDTGSSARETGGKAAEELTTQQLNLDGSVIVRKSGTIAPLDEVIFTRIDMLRDREQVNQGPSSTATQGTSEENDITVTTDLLETTVSDEIEEFTTNREEDSSSGHQISDDNRLREEGGITIEIEDTGFNISIENGNVNNGTETKCSSPSPVEDRKEEILTDNDNSKANSYFGPNQTPIKQVIHEIEKDNPDLVIINDSTQSTLQDIITSLNDQATNNDVDESQESEETTDDLISVVNKEDQTVNTNNYMNAEVKLGDKDENYISTTTENYSTASNLEVSKAKVDLIDNSLGESNIRAGAVELRVLLNTETTEVDGTDYTKSELENTTPYFTEDHVVQSEIGAAKLQDTENLKTTLYAESTTEPVPDTTLYKLDLIKQSTDYNHAEGTVTESKTLDKGSESSLTTVKSSNRSSPIASQGELEHENILQPEPTTQNNEYLEPSTMETIEERKEQNPYSLDIIQIASSNNTNDNVSDTPPVVELNSHVPFLQLGGHDNYETSDDYLDTTTTKTENKDTYTSDSSYTTDVTNTIVGSSDLLTKSQEAENTYQGKLYKEDIKEYTSENYEDVPSTTTHLLLTPEDLKMLSEYLINDTIKPALSKNNTVHDRSTQTGIKGNITSEEKFAFILSAANISIGVMNQTNLEEKSTTDSVKADKFEKDTVFKGNSIVDSDSDIINKKNYLYNKLNIKSDLLKNTIKTSTKSHEGVMPTSEIIDTSTEIEASTQGILENISKLSENQSSNVLASDMETIMASKLSSIKKHNDSQHSTTTQESANNQLGSPVRNENKPRLEVTMSQPTVTNKENKVPSRVERISHSEGTESTSDSSLVTDLHTPDDMTQEPLVIP